MVWLVFLLVIKNFPKPLIKTPSPLNIIALISWKIALNIICVVGMTTAFPEAVLAGELGIPYAVLCGVTNIAPAEHNGMEVTEAMKVTLPKMKVCILQAIDWLVENEHPDDCPCRKGREESVFC